jgi:hypothetical protein
MKKAIACVLLAVLPACADVTDDDSIEVEAAAAVAGPLSETPDPLVFPNAMAGDGACGSAGSQSCTYAMATLKNSGTVNQRITAASASGPFWVTWGGTCNNTTNAKTIRPGVSCTLQFGFAPTTASATSRGTGTVTFASGLVLRFGLRGTSVAGLTATPNPLVFSSTAVGGISYGMITINNNFSVPQTITGGLGGGPFWVTWGGTCNTDTKTIASHTSCTLQWGFAPTAVGTTTATGTVSFSSGQNLSVGLQGTGF